MLAMRILIIIEWFEFLVLLQIVCWMPEREWKLIHRLRLYKSFDAAMAIQELAIELNANYYNGSEKEVRVGMIS